MKPQVEPAPPAPRSYKVEQPAQRLLAALRSAGRALLRLPRPLAALILLGWMLAIWGLSSLQAGSGGGVLRRMSFFANLGHAFEFGMLALAWVMCLPRRAGWVSLGSEKCVAIWLLSVAYAVIDEVHQLSVPGRDGTPFDVLTDGVGAACVLWIIHYLGRADALGSGLVRRLGLCLLYCLCSAALAANHQRLFGW